MRREDIIKRLNEVGIYEGVSEQYIDVVETDDDYIIIIDGTFRVKKEDKGN